MKTLSFVFQILAVLLSDLMCAKIARSYYILRWGKLPVSAPAWMAFLWGIPFLLAIAVCVTLALVFKKKAA